MAPKKPTPPAAAVKQLNIRVTDDIAQAFRSFCADQRCTQSDGLAYLLSNQLPDHITPLAYNLSYYKDYVRYLQSEFEYYKRKCIERQRNEREVRRALTNYASEIVHTIQTNYGTSLPHPEAIRPSSYRRTKQRKNLRQYSYPAQAGCTLFTLSDIAYGNSKNSYEINMGPMFIFGETEDGKIKYRWYPRHDYIGISLHNKTYALRNSQWIVAYKISKDGAADLIAGVPLSLFGQDTRAPNYYVRFETSEDGEERSSIEKSLDDLISAAKTRRDKQL